MKWVLALVLAANAAFYAWTQGWLSPLLPLPPSLAGREPERLQRQVRPESITVLSPRASASAASEPGAETAPAEGAAPAAAAASAAASAAAPAASR